MQATTLSTADPAPPLLSHLLRALRAFRRVWDEPTDGASAELALEDGAG